MKGRRNMYYNNILDKKKIGQFLKNSIRERYTTIAEFARQTGQTYQTVHSWTSGERLPELGDMVANCSILDIPLEYVLVGTNDGPEYSDILLEEDEYKEKARFKYPNLIVQDIAIIMPLLDIRNFIDIMGRAIDCSDSFYIVKLFRQYIRMDSDEWKYCVYVLQRKNSPLVANIPRIKAKETEIDQWYNIYEKRKSDYIEGMKNMYNAMDMITKAKAKITTSRR